MISNLTLLTGATITPSGGTTQTFAPTGTNVSNGIEVSDVASTDYITQNRVQCKSKMPTYSNGEYSKMKCSATFLMPTVDSTGKTQFNLVRVEIEKHPEFTSADLLELKKKGAQLLTDADLDAFWSNGSLS